MKYQEYLFEHGMLYPNEIGSLISEESTEEGEKIAKAIGVRFVGFWKDIGKYLFNDDDETGTSFLAKDIEEARRKLKEKRKEFLAYA